MYVYVYVYLYIFIYTHTHTHTYTYIQAHHYKDGKRAQPPCYESRALRDTAAYSNQMRLINSFPRTPNSPASPYCPNPGYVCGGCVWGMYVGMHVHIYVSISTSGVCMCKSISLNLCLRGMYVRIHFSPPWCNPHV